jgi:AraC-like DNA-binding protein
MATLQSSIATLRRWLLARAGADGAREAGYPGLVTYRFARRTALRKQPAIGVSLCVGLQGRKRMRVGSADLTVDPRDYIVITRDTYYDCTVTPEAGDRPFLSLSVTFPPEIVARVLGALADEGVVPSGDVVAAYSAPLTRDLGDALVRFVRSVDDPVERRTLTPLISEELAFRLLRSDAGAAMRAALRPQDALRITDAMRIMRATATARLSVSDIAKQVAMSPSHFAHRFRAIARMSPMRFVKEVRLEQARTLLLAEQARASDIAVRVGYESPSHFTRDFKRRFGMSPARYADQGGVRRQTVA